MVKNSLRVAQREKTVVIPYDVLTINHQGKDIGFGTPIVGPGTYAGVAEALRNQDVDLLQPTMAQTASLIHAGFNGDNKYSKQIKKIMKNHWFWGFTGNKWVPKEGVYIQNNPEIVEGRVSMDKQDLVKKLESGDVSVRFVPFGFKIGKQTALELAKNPYIIGLAGEKGADKLAQVADKHRNKPYLYAFDNVDNELTRLSALSSDWVDDRLDVCGNGFDNGDYGFAFGVLNESSEADAKN